MTAFAISNEASPGKTMNKTPLTPYTYAHDLAVMSRKHGGEVVLATFSVVAVGLALMTTRALLHLQPLGGRAYLLFVVIAPLLLVMLLATAVSSWRLYRRQFNALETMRSLRELDAADIREHDRYVDSRDRLRVPRVEAREVAQVERITIRAAARRPIRRRDMRI